MEGLKIATGYAVLVFVALLGAMILWRILDGKIDLSRLITDESGDASMSRFQLLIFTFVIALSLFLVVVGQEQPKFPDLPGSILSLLGISASSYLVSKGISSASDVTPRTVITISPAAPTVAPGGTVQFAAAISGQPTRSVTWSIDAPAKASIDSQGKMTADRELTTGEIITVRASSDEGSASAVVQVI
jgi:hypothetical protein